MAAVIFIAAEARGAQLTLSWDDNSRGHAKTRIERRLATDATFAFLADAGPGATSFIDHSVVPDTTYCYRLQARADEGTSEYSAEACGTAGYDVTIAKSGSGLGTVTSAPPGIDCGTTCTSTFHAGAPLVLLAIPAPGSRFTGWSGGGCGDMNPCTLLRNTPVAVKAGFAAIASSAPPLSGQCALPPGEAWASYGASCTISGGVPPYACTVESGALPAGVGFGADCAVRGVPWSAGDNSFKVRVADASGSAQVIAGRLNVAPPLNVTTASLAPVAVNTPFRRSLSVVGGRAPYSWSIVYGTLPRGVTLHPQRGELTGASPVAGASAFVVQVKDAAGAIRQRVVWLVANQGPLTATCRAGLGEVGVPYGGACTPRGGLAPYRCLPAAPVPAIGLTLNADCSITGTPASAQTTTLSGSLADSGGVTIPLRVGINVRPHVGLAASGLTYATVNESVVHPLQVTGGAAPYSWTVSAGALPAGLTLDPKQGRIVGQATKAGFTWFVVQVSDALGARATQPVVMVVNHGALTATCGTHPGQVGHPYAAGCAPRGGLAPYACLMASGALPAGLTLQYNCTITGTPGAAGTTQFTTRVYDSGGLSVIVHGEVTVAPPTKAPAPPRVGWAPAP